MSELCKLPDSWKWKTLSDIVVEPKKDIVDGPFGSDLKATEYIDSGVPLIRLQNINRFEFLFKDIKYISNIKSEQLKRHSFNVGDLVLNKLGDVIGKCCEVPSSLGNGIIVADIVRIKVDEQKNSKKFVLYSINSPITLEHLCGKSKGATRQRVNLKDIREIPIPLPPLPEQQRIVKKLDLLFEKIDKAIFLHQKNIDEAEAFMGSVLNEVFEELEEKYKIVEVGSVTNCIVPQRNKPKQFIGNIQWITTEDLILFKRISKSSKGLGLTMEDIAETQSKVIPKDSVLMSCVGDLGMVSIADDNIVVNQQLHTFQCHSNLNNKYLTYSLFVKKNLMYQIANITTVAYMNKSKCNSIPLPLPPLAIQQKTAQYLDNISEKIERVKTIQKEKMANLKALKASILDKAFRGEI